LYVDFSASNFANFWVTDFALWSIIQSTQSIEIMLGSASTNQLGRLNAFMVIILLIMFFWVKTPFGLVGRSQHFEEVCCLHLQGWSNELGPTGHLNIRWQEGKCERKGQTGRAWYWLNLIGQSLTGHWSTQSLPHLSWLALSFRLPSCHPIWDCAAPTTN
jgi:hypothetical protein